LINALAHHGCYVRASADFRRTCRASEMAMPALSLVGQFSACFGVGQAGRRGGPLCGLTIRIIANY